MREAYQCSEIVPNFRNVRVEADGTRVRIECVTVLVDLVVQDSDGAPECWIASVTIDSLLVCLVRLGILLLRHVAASEKIPALGVIVI